MCRYTYRRFLVFLRFLQIVSLPDRRQKEVYNTPVQHRQATQDLQAWNHLLELSLTCLCRAGGLEKAHRNQRNLLLRC